MKTRIHGDGSGKIRWLKSFFRKTGSKGSEGLGLSFPGVESRGLEGQETTGKKGPESTPLGLEL